ncbi:Fatty acid omega-hydroxylase [Cladobotryum mycophilum]|uniref:Bifunctional cytochrome P450/NADPH--P450 reductase n=1 Tax=Cladobotryum mycophilum TaxID=491253 RepID=A0ABR0SX34_9HYPO
MADNEASNFVEIPSPKSLPLLGHMHQLDFDGPFQSILEATLPLGPICQMSFGGERDIFISSRELLNEICDESRFAKSVTADLDKLRYAVHDGLFTAHNEEPNWGIAHRILMPVFGPLKIRDMFPEMKDIAQQLCLKWARYGEEYTIDVADDFTRLTLDTIALCAMGFRFNSFHSGTEMHPFVGSMNGMLKEAGVQALLPNFINTFRIKSMHRFESDIALLRNTCYEIIQKRKNNKAEADSKDLLGALLNGRDPKTGEGLSEDAIINNMITFLIAGHETTSGMLSFAFYFLLANPETMETARQEIDKVTGGSPIAVEHVGKLPYINALLRETLRLQPTAPAFAVASKKDEVLGGKYRIPAGAAVTTLLHHIHRDKAVYGEDADEFKPERMLDENFNKLPPNSWKPFGNGMRGCIGRAFAWQEALLITAMLLQNFTFEMADPTYKLRIKENLTLKPGESTGSSEPSKSTPASSLASQNTNGKKPMTILYGSNSGTCESLAYRLAADAALRGFYARTVAPMDTASKNLPTSEPVVILTASYDGLPADNATEFLEWLRSLEEVSLNGVSYAVFGCGHRDWVATFHRVPILVDELLEKAGAKRFAPRGLADSATMDLFVELEEWATKSVWPAIIDTDSGGHSESNLISSLLRVEFSQPRPLKQYSSQLIEATVVESKELTAVDSIGKKRHVEIRLPQDVSYQPGDHLLVLPVNPVRNVKRVLSRFYLTWDTVVRASGDDSVRIPTETPITAFELLSSYLELAQPATPRDIRVLAAAVEKESLKQTLNDLATTLYAAEIQEKRVSLLDVLENFPEIPLALSTFLALLPPLRLRTYSISSSPSWNPQHAALTVSVVDEPTTTPSSGRFLGVASNYLAGLTPGDVIHVVTRSVKGIFQMPGDLSKTPIMMVASGSGLAPFRGFIQERAHQKRSGVRLAPAVLFFGCRSTADDMYREELDEFEASGVVQVFRAYSRAGDDDAQLASGTTRGYVQDSLAAHKDSVATLWNEGAKVYVCGSVKMAAQVKDAVVKIVYDVSQVGEQNQVPQEWFKQFEAERYAAEIFA